MKISSKPALRHKLFSCLFVIVSSLFVLSYAHAAQEDKIEVYVDTNHVEFAIDPYLYEGTTLVQLRPLFESLGIELEWNGETMTVTGKKGKDQFSLTIGQSIATVNGQTVALALPARLTDGHTLVPLRFVSEAAGAEVGWHGDSKTIQVYSKEYIQILGITKEEAEKAVSAGPPLISESRTGLQGFYARAFADLLGTRGCGGVCWDYYYFIDDHQFTKGLPEGPLERIDCSREECFPYEVKGSQLILDGAATHSIEIAEDGILIDGNFYNRHEPLLRPKLDGTYVASGYVSLPSGGGFASSSTLIFSPDGTFYDDRFIGVITDGSDYGDGTGVSSTHLSDSEAAGRYTVINHSILLEYADGTTESLLFFRPDLNDQMYKIGGSDYLLTEPVEPNEEYAQRKEQETVITEPLQDKLLTEGIADKKVIKQHNPGVSEQMGVTEIELVSYQWAELDIHPEHRDTFSGFGDGPVAALTVKYNLINKATEGLDLSTLKSTVWVSDGYVLETASLSPNGTGILEKDGSEERLAVFLFPANILKEYDRFELVFSDLKTEHGYEAFHENELDFWLTAPY
ncbi:copper amine oxidase N-terminal domain-containing protein [Paenibacillus senegalensis]|uniref:copper amine oxidase N-terminal domain-containing protein n=1 Tax=Paenibacillus senegalensis TaxID=1465766 RepID=UPI000287DF71|nr:copper amine oxidase N-terminal domain-containing protein [Paenibacillus senegalensis]